MLSIVPILIAMASLIISLYVAYRAWKFNELSTRRASRQAHVQMLFEIDKLLIQYPELWGIYDTNPLGEKRDSSPLAVARREAFLYQHFNIFYVVHDYYMNIITRDKADDDNWKSWETYLKQLFIQSTEARRLFKESRSQEIYTRQFRDVVNGILAEVERSECPTNTSTVQ